MPRAKNGYDLFLEFQFDQTGDFYKALFNAISRADVNNIEKLRLGFPEEVDAMERFRFVGEIALLSKCSAGHPLIEKMLYENSISEITPAMKRQAERQVLLIKSVKNR